MLAMTRRAPEPSPELMPLERGADYLGCSVKTVRRLIQSGDLTGYRVGKKMMRVDMCEVRDFVRVIPTAKAG